MRKINSSVISSSVLVLCLTFSACGGGGGGSSDSGTLIEGTLTEAGGAGHTDSLALKHEVDERIENVQICALGECSTTDGQGQWGMVTDGSFSGGDVLFTINGHGIDTTTVVTIPNGANEVFLDFRHVEGGRIEAHHITVDGETSHHEDEAHQHE